MPPEEKPPVPVFDTLIPEEFKDRPYLNDLKALQVGPDAYKALFSKLDGAQKLIGKKTGIPEAGAPPEEWDQFHARLRPTTAEEYEFAAKDGADPDFTKAVKGMFFEAGLTKSQAAKLQTKFDAYITEKTAGQTAESKRLDEEFEALTKTTFGAENMNVLALGKSLLAELTPDSLKPHLARLPNEALVVLAGVMASVRAKYLGEDKGGGGGGGGGGAPTDSAALREEAKKLMTSDAWKDFRHPDHDKARVRVDEIYRIVGAAASAGKR